MDFDVFKVKDDLIVVYFHGNAERKKGTKTTRILSGARMTKFHDVPEKVGAIEYVYTDTKKYMYLLARVSSLILFHNGSAYTPGSDGPYELYLTETEVFCRNRSQIKQLMPFATNKIKKNLLTCSCFAFDLVENTVYVKFFGYNCIINLGDHYRFIPDPKSIHIALFDRVKKETVFCNMGFDYIDVKFYLIQDKGDITIPNIQFIRVDEIKFTLETDAISTTEGLWQIPPDLKKALTVIWYMHGIFVVYLTDANNMSTLHAQMLKRKH